MIILSNYHIRILQTTSDRKQRTCLTFIAKFYSSSKQLKQKPFSSLGEETLSILVLYFLSCGFYIFILNLQAFSTCYTSTFNNIHPVTTARSSQEGFTLKISPLNPCFFSPSVLQLFSCRCTNYQPMQGIYQWRPAICFYCLQ